MNELNEARAADDFCSKKHLLNRIAKKKSPVNQKARKLGTTTQNKNLCSCYSITYINPMDKRTKLFQIFEKLGLKPLASPKVCLSTSELPPVSTSVSS
jgi:hypothetical protein